MQYNEACRVSLCFSTFQNPLEIHSNTDQPTFLLNRRHSCHSIYFKMNSMKFGFRSREFSNHFEQISYSHIILILCHTVPCRIHRHSIRFLARPSPSPRLVPGTRSRPIACKYRFCGFGRRRRGLCGGAVRRVHPLTHRCDAHARASVSLVCTSRACSAMCALIVGCIRDTRE